MAKGKLWIKEYRKERREHPTLPLWAIKQIVKDHQGKRR
jgi:hypothetical protein